MKIDVTWLPPLDLWEASADKLIYDCYTDELPGVPGIYVFARRFGNSVEPLYVGQARNLQNRVNHQLANLKLMMHVKQAKIGPRVLIAAEVNTHVWKNYKSALDLVELSLIRHYLTEGCNLHNRQGTKIASDEIVFDGSLLGRKTCPPKIAVPRANKR